MKKLLALSFTLLLGASLSLAQGSTDTGAKNTSKQAKSKTSTAAEKVELNPQPLPPGAKSKSVTPADKVSLNPQPLPPREKSKTVTPAEKVSLNPQPLPPKTATGTGASAANKVSLNPQPEPPGAQSAKTRKAGGDNKKVSVPAATTSPR